MTAQLSLPVCVIPGCTTPVGEWGKPCDGCLVAFGDMIQHNPGGRRMSAEEIVARDTETAQAYAAQARADGACKCWTTSPLTGHAGHCCFRAGELEDYQLGHPAPCGHFVAVT